MPWKESDKVSERMRFLTRYFEGERIADLCRAFGISRQTGHALVKRYERFGSDGLDDRPSRPLRSPQQTPKSKADAIVALRKKHPTWGPKKLKARLQVLHPNVKWPAASTIGLILSDEGLVKQRKRRRRATPLGPVVRETTAPNELWCIDYKGQFRLGNRKYCYPLTVSDHYSRFLLGCEALENTKTEDAETTFLSIFSEYGLPDAIRSDNGAPFASSGRLGFSRLSVWFARLGIAIERIQPGHPEQNSRHERMHLTLKQEATRPPGANILAQQEKLDVFKKSYNQERPHESLDMKTPAQLYRSSKRALPKALPELTYPLHDACAKVYACGRFTLPMAGDIYIGRAFAHQRVGLTEVAPGSWRVSFMDYDLGYADVETKRVIPFATIENNKTP